MSDFLKNMTFWRWVGAMFLIGAVGFAVARIIMAARGTSPEADAYRALAESSKQNNLNP